jgi:hypothetical protein
MKIRFITVPYDCNCYASFPGLTQFNGVLHLVHRVAGISSRNAALTGLPTHHDKDSWVVHLVSENGGDSWSEPKIIFSTDLGVNDPSITALSDGRLLARFTELDVQPKSKRDSLRGPLLAHRSDLGIVCAVSGNYISFSHDGGESWETPQLMDLENHRHSITREPVVELSDGTLLLSMYSSSPFNTESTFVIRSWDGGQTWRDVSLLASDLEGVSSQFRGVNYNESALISLDQNKLLAIIRSDESYFTNNGKDFMTVGGVGEFISAFSFNAGLSWSPLTPTGVFGQPASLALLPGGRIFMSYGRRTKPYAICYRVSDDFGIGWSREYIIRDQISVWDFGYPATAITDHAIHIAYYIPDTEGIRHIEIATIQIEDLEGLT